jgi:transposase
MAMEACGSAHHWGRWFAARGHTALIAAEFVVPFRKVARMTPPMQALHRRPATDVRFVPIKSVDQQAILAWHSVRRLEGRTPRC